MSSRAHRNIRKVFSAKLLQTRLRRDLTQFQLGQRCGLSGKFIGEIERGEKSISLDNLVRVAGALKTPVTSLITNGRR